MEWLWYTSLYTQVLFIGSEMRSVSCRVSDFSGTLCGRSSFFYFWGCIGFYYSVFSRFTAVFGDVFCGRFVCNAVFFVLSSITDSDLPTEVFSSYVTLAFSFFPDLLKQLAQAHFLFISSYFSTYSWLPFDYAASQLLYVVYTKSILPSYPSVGLWAAYWPLYIWYKLMFEVTSFYVFNSSD